MGRTENRLGSKWTEQQMALKGAQMHQAAPVGTMNVEVDTQQFSEKKFRHSVGKAAGVDSRRVDVLSVKTEPGSTTVLFQVKPVQGNAAEVERSSAEAMAALEGAAADGSLNVGGKAVSGLSILKPDRSRPQSAPVLKTHGPKHLYDVGKAGGETRFNNKDPRDRWYSPSDIAYSTNNPGEKKNCGSYILSSHSYGYNSDEIKLAKPPFARQPVVRENFFRSTGIMVTGRGPVV